MDGTVVTHDFCHVIEADSTAFAIPTELQWVGKACDYLSQRAQASGACNADRLGKMTVALTEAITNAIVHGNLGISSALKEQGSDVFARAVAQRSADPVLRDRQTRIRYEFDGAECHVTIADEGEGFDYLSWIRTLDQAGEEAPSDLCSGRGILMMRALADQVEFSDGGRQVKLTWRAPSWEERRASRRRPWNQLVRVLPLAADGGRSSLASWQPALGRDLSDGGLALVQNKPVAGQRILIEIHENGVATYAPAEVCRMTILEDGLIQIGCRFRSEKNTDAADEPMTSPGLRRLLDQLDHDAPPQDERRAHRRASYSATIQIRGEGGEFRSAFSRDLSRGGMALLASFKLPHGPAEIRLPVAGEEDQLVQAKVVRCQRVSDGVYDIGCQFTG